MPAYANNPFTPAKFLAKGVATYLFGSYNFHQADTQMYVSNVALTSNVATLTVQIYGGEVPIVGALISVRQTASTSGLFNVSRVPLTGVTIDLTTGAGTVTFALTHADVVSVANTGSAVVEVPEVGEALANGASIAVAIAAPEGDSQFTVPLAVTFPGNVLPTAATVNLQGALRNVDSEFTNVSSPVAVVAGTAWTTGPFSQVTLQRGYWYRVNVSGVTAGSATGIVVKLGG